MSFHAELTRRNLLKGAGALVVSFSVAGTARTENNTWPKVIAKDQLDSWIAIAADGSVTCFTGRIDIGGTGVGTAIAQIVAEELDIDFARVHMVMGDTATTPDQGITSASATIQKEAIPIRHAAAEARQVLLELASKHFGVPTGDLTCNQGMITAPTGAAISYGDLIGGRRFALKLAYRARLKKVSDYKIVGKSIPRADIAAKATASFPFVHDVRRPGMLHGRVIRPPCTGSETAIGSRLIAIDESSVNHIPGIARIVRIGDFLGVVAEREENAVRAARELKVEWRLWSEMPDFDRLEPTLRAHPGKRRMIADDGDVDAALGTSAQALSATYIWPYQHHASLGPSCAVAEMGEDGTLTIWSSTRAPHAVRREAAQLLSIPEESVRVIQRQGAGCYGLNCADDVSLDAALLSRAVRRPVRVQLMRDQEQGWEPKAAALLVDCRGGLDKDGNIIAYQFTTKYFTGRGETLAHYLTGARPAKPVMVPQGDRNAIPPYNGIPNLHVAVLDVVPPIRAGVMRGVASLPNSFAHECFIDELAFAANADPLKFRLDRLGDPRARAVLEAAANQAGWQPRTEAPQPAPLGSIGRGRGIAYARYTHGDNPPYAAAYTAWVAEVEVNTATGQVKVNRVVVAQDAGLIINPAGVRSQIHGNVIQSISRALMEEAKFDKTGVASIDYASYPIARFSDVPEIEIVLIENPNHPCLGVGESTTVPSAGAIGNAIFDAIGVRVRRAPFSPRRIKSAMSESFPE
jgi:nicotinate dehydrogenase subunit B